MTLSEILAALYDETGNSASPAAAVTTRFKRFINEGLRSIMAEPGLARLRDSDLQYTFASVANTARYVVPEAVERLVYLTERTNDRKLASMDLATYRAVCPDPTAMTGTPTHYVPVGRVAVATQPSDTSAVYVKSSSAPDTTQTVYIEGILAGELYSVSASLNGTTAVAVGSVSFDQITDFYISAVCGGTVSLMEDSGVGAVLSTIGAGRQRPRYYGFYLYPTPSAAVTYYVDYRRELIDLSNDSDEPTLPTNYHPMLVAYGLMREYERLDQADRMSAAAERFTYALQRLKASVNVPDDVLVPYSRTAVRRSDLGGAYPAGTIWD